MHQVRKCPKCLAKVIYTAEKCPNCGEVLRDFSVEDQLDMSLPKRPGKKKMLLFLVPLMLGAVIICLVFLIFSGGALSTPERALEALLNAAASGDVKKVVPLLDEESRRTVEQDPAALETLRKNLIGLMSRTRAEYKVIESSRVTKDGVTSQHMRVGFTHPGKKGVTHERDFKFVRLSGRWYWVSPVSTHGTKKGN
jgi:hypothetical protein